MICGLHPYQDLSPFQLASQGYGHIIKPEPMSPGMVSKEPLFLPCPSHHSDTPEAGPSMPNSHIKTQTRKFADLDDESSQGSQAIVKRTLFKSGGGRCETIRRGCDQGTRGETGRSEDREVERLLVDLGYFKASQTSAHVARSYTQVEQAMLTAGRTRGRMIGNHEIDGGRYRTIVSSHSLFCLPFSLSTPLYSIPVRHLELT